MLSDRDVVEIPLFLNISRHIPVYSDSCGRVTPFSTSLALVKVSRRTHLWVIYTETLQHILGAPGSSFSPVYVDLVDEMSALFKKISP